MSKKIAGFLTIAIFSAVLLASGVAQADLGPHWGEGNEKCNMVYPTGYSHNECMTYCSQSSVCEYTEFDGRQWMSGFWGREFINNPEFKIYHHYRNDNKYPGGITVLDYCKGYCEEQERQCETEECRSFYKPADIDCAGFPANERAKCESGCSNNILTSACAKKCLQFGISEENVQVRGCSFMCEEYRDCHVEGGCSSLPAKPSDNWSLLAILMTLLALGTTGLIVFFNHRASRRA